MNQSQLLELMKNFAAEGTVLPPVEAMAFIAEYLERMRLTMDQTDYEGLLYTGACVWKLHTASKA